MWGEVLTVVLATVGAGLGGLFGASVAFRKHRRQRAFDLRAEWYAEMVKALMHQHGLLIQSALEIKRAIEAGTPPSEKAATARLATLDFLGGRFSELLQQATLYASKDGAVRLQEVGRMKTAVQDIDRCVRNRTANGNGYLFSVALTGPERRVDGGFGWAI